MNPITMWRDLLAITPEIFVLGASLALLIFDLFLSQSRRGVTHFLALVVVVLTMVLIVQPRDVVEQTVFGGMFIRDALSDLIKLSMLGVSFAVFVYARPYLSDRGLFRGEFYALCLLGILGMMLLVSAGSLIMIYLGLELLALSSYALVAFNRDSSLSSEAAMKYFVLGALASGMLLYGMSILYGATGSLDLSVIQNQASVAYQDQRLMLSFGLVFIVVGLAFKLGAAPFHMWLPDVYQGSPTAVTLYIASVPKLAAFGMAYRLFDGALINLQTEWQGMLALLALLSLAVGNVVAIAQTNLKRMLAYSTISHIGFLLLGILNGTREGYSAALFYAITYALTTVAAFGLIILLSKSGFEAEEISDFSGLNKRNAWYAGIGLMIMASLAGIPVWVGFVAKLAVLKASLEAGYLWLTLAAGVFAVIGAFYYLRVIKTMYFDPPKNNDVLHLPNDIPFRMILSFNGILLLLLGIFSGPLWLLCLQVVPR
jgi:NADH-quinone oxidoreductase subunit N